MPTTSNFGWTTPADTDLVKDGAAAIRTLGNGIDTSFLDLKGGTTDQVLAKNSNTDLDFKWVAQDDANAIQNTIIDAKGDLIVGSAADTPARLAVGTNGHILTADSSEATGLKWAAPASGGKVLQVLQDTANTMVSNSTMTYAATGLSQAITCSSASSKVLVMVSLPIFKSEGNSGNAIQIQIKRDSTSILETASITLYTETTLRQHGQWAYSYLDSPASTSSLTYAVEFRNRVAQSTVQVCSESAPASIILLEIGA